MLSLWGSADGFVSRALSSACFQSSRKVAVSMEALKIVMSDVLIVGRPKMKTWWSRGWWGPLNVLIAW